MAEIYGHRWTSAYGESSDMDGAAGTWAKGLDGITPEQVGIGLQACITSADPWPPTLPAFRGMCLGIPSFEVVKADIGTRKHGFTRMVWQHLDHWMFTRADQRDAERQLRSAYDFARERRMCGDEFPIESVQIEHEKPAPYVAPSREERLENCARAVDALRA